MGTLVGETNRFHSGEVSVPGHIAGLRQRLAGRQCLRDGLQSGVTTQQDGEGHQL